MTDSTRKRPAVIWIVVAALIAAYAGWMTVQFDRMRDHAAAAHARERALVEQIQQLAMHAPARRGDAAAPQATVTALLRRPDLIPLEPVLGGTFYFLEDSVVQLDRYVYATVEDGHIRGHVVLLHHGGDHFETLHAYVE